MSQLSFAYATGPGLINIEAEEPIAANTRYTYLEGKSVEIRLVSKSMHLSSASYMCKGIQNMQSLTCSQGAEKELSCVHSNWIGSMADDVVFPIRIPCPVQAAGGGFSLAIGSDCQSPFRVVAAEGFPLH